MQKYFSRLRLTKFKQQFLKNVEITMALSGFNKITCDKCFAEFISNESQYGQSLLCPQCNAEIYIPIPEAIQDDADNISTSYPCRSLEKTIPMPAAASKFCDNLFELQPFTEFTEKEIWRGNPTYQLYIMDFIIGVLLLPLFGLGLALIILAIMDRKATTYLVTDKRIMVLSGIIARITCEIALRDIKSINIQQLSLLERIYNQGTVEIVSIASVIKFSSVMKPDWVGNIIRQQMQKHSR